jgi:hypothetical protein
MRFDNSISTKKEERMTNLISEKSNGWTPLRRRFLHMPLLFACFAVVSISASTTAVAGDQVPFNGTVLGQIPSDLGPPVPGSGGCVFDFFVNNSGNAIALGNFIGQAEFRPNLCNGSYTGAFHWIAANGDEISGTFFGQLVPTEMQGVFDNNETAIVSGGTGRFTDAVGLFTLLGQVNFNTLSFVLPWHGTISSVGSVRRR